MKKIILLLILLLTVDVVYAATIHGTIYDLSLNKAKDVVVEIDTLQKQRLVSKDGLYSFNVPPGNYLITAKYYENSILQSKTEEPISIKDEGEYILDLFLFPNLDEESEMLNETNIVIEDKYFEKKINYLAIILSLIVILFSIYFYARRMMVKGKQKKEITEKEDNDYLTQVLNLIKKDKRITQKDIRKQFPLSEAKISLIITELESKGKIRKIKKGRGNILILNE